MRCAVVLAVALLCLSSQLVFFGMKMSVSDKAVEDKAAADKTAADKVAADKAAADKTAADKVAADKAAADKTAADKAAADTAAAEKAAADKIAADKAAADKTAADKAASDKATADKAAAEKTAADKAAAEKTAADKAAAEKAAEDKTAADKAAENKAQLTTPIPVTLPVVSDTLFPQTCFNDQQRLCNNTDTPTCRWIDTPPCNFTAYDQNKGFDEVFTNRTFVFRGDSILRETFDLFSTHGFNGMRVLKEDANGTHRVLNGAHNLQTNSSAFFMFDMKFDHIVQQLDPTVVPGRVDIVVLSLALWEARDLAAPNTVRNTTTVRELIGQNVVKSVCEVHRARYGIWLGTWMDCDWVRLYDTSADHKNYLFHCDGSKPHSDWIHNTVRNHTMAVLSESPTCTVYYLPGIECVSRANCTWDGAHSQREHVFSKFESIYNAIRLLLRRI